MESAKFSRIRDSVLSALGQKAVVPVDFSSLNLPDTIPEFKFFHTHVLSFHEKLKLRQIVDKLIKEAPEGKVTWFLNYDLPSIIWMIVHGIVDDQGNPIFTEDDAVVFSSKYESLIYHLAWEVMKTNDIWNVDKQETVGNSEGEGN